MSSRGVWSWGDGEGWAPRKGPAASLRTGAAPRTRSSGSCVLSSGHSRGRRPWWNRSSGGVCLFRNAVLLTDFRCRFVFLVSLSRKRLNLDSIAGEQERPAKPQQSLGVDGMGRSRRSHSADTNLDTVRGVQSWRWAMPWNFSGSRCRPFQVHSVCVHCTIPRRAQHDAQTFDLATRLPQWHPNAAAANGLLLAIR